MKYDVFISYSRKDKEVVNEFASKLKSHGYNIWMDVDGIESGDAFKVKIVNAIRNSSLFLFFSSKASNESEWTVKEVNVAVNMHKPIIPIKLDDCIYNDSILFDLSGMDYIDVNIDGDLKLSVERVLRSIKKNISEEPDSYKNNKDENKDTVVVETVKLNSLNRQNDNIQENTTNVFYDAAERYYKMGEEAFNKEKYEEAVKWFRKAAEQGHADAQYQLGSCYQYGFGISKDEVEAVKWYRKAAEQGDADAQYLLGSCYQCGCGVSKDEVEAVKWYTKAAEQGQTCAQYFLSLCYHFGSGVSKDEVEAVKWYRKAAEQEDAYAAIEVIKLSSEVIAHADAEICFLLGEEAFDKEKYEEAVKWYRKAAEQGNSHAQHILGLCYLYGSGISKDEVEVVKWNRKAAEQGHADAQYILGWCYQYGKGVSKNESEAVKWYRKAAEQGHEDAIKALKELQK